MINVKITKIVIGGNSDSLSLLMFTVKVDVEIPKRKLKAMSQPKGYHVKGTTAISNVFHWNPQFLVIGRSNLLTTIAITYTYLLIQPGNCTYTLCSLFNTCLHFNSLFNIHFYLFYLNCSIDSV